MILTSDFLMLCPDRSGWNSILRRLRNILWPVCGNISYDKRAEQIIFRQSKQVNSETLF